ncbi:MAG: anti-sigma factor [Rhodocyclaceae bacterium]|nr:anti-sigma factor [Rhodocyclaceae bacterium]
MKPDTLSDEQLCAFVDGRLDAAATERVARQLAADPALAARAEAWRAQNAALHTGFDALLDAPVPARLLAAANGAAPTRRGGVWLRYAAAVAWLAIGGVAGYMLRDRAAGDATYAIALPRQAAIAHAVYVPEVRHPVEVGVDQQDHLVGWLTKRLGVEVPTPDLQAEGFALMGGRLLPGDTGPGAQLMYQDAAGVRLTLYLSRREAGRSTAFRFAQEDEVSVFYWVDNGTGYAVSGALPRERLLAVATALYRQLNP